jgi:hypothetical protein
MPEDEAETTAASVAVEASDSVVGTAVVVVVPRALLVLVVG